MKKTMIAAVGVLMLATVSGAYAQDEQDDQASYWMKKKLEYSERILSGLAKEDYDEIAKSARSMNALSHLEKWVRSGLPAYRAQLRIFENANEQLIKSADDKHLDGAALAYVQLTLSCVNCHKVVRDSAAESPSRTR